MEDTSFSRDGEAMGVWNRFAPFARLLLMFFVFSFLGWAYEMLNDAIVQGGWHWRAALVGPWCPMYGIGGLLICWIGKPFRFKGKARDAQGILRAVGRVLLAALVITVLVSVVELIASYVSEAILGFMPWDYSTSWGNFEGRWAPEFTLRFVIGGLVFLYVLEPLISLFVKRFTVVASIIALILSVIFLVDCALEASGFWNANLVRGGEVFVQPQ